MQHIQVTNVGKSVLQHVQLKVIKINIRDIFSSGRQYSLKCKCKCCYNNKRSLPAYILLLSKIKSNPVLFVRNNCREDTPLCGLHRYVQPQRVWFFCHFGHKKGIDCGHFGIKQGIAFIHVCVFKNKPLFHHCRKDHKKSFSLIMFRVGLIWGTN